MSTTYSSRSDFEQRELVEVLNAQGDNISKDFPVGVLFDRLEEAGLVEWFDAYDADRDAYLLDQQGYRWVPGVLENDPEGAAFWGFVEELNA